MIQSRRIFGRSTGESALLWASEHQSYNMVVVGKQREENVAEPVLANLLADDRTPWYKKPNLRRLYFILFPACMGIEITSGFDSQIINTVQIVYTWNKCMFLDSG